MDEKASTGDDARRQVIDLVSRAEAIVERLEAGVADGRWAMTAFSRYRLCELLEILPYGRYEGDLQADPVGLLEEAAQLADQTPPATAARSARAGLRVFPRHRGAAAAPCRGPGAVRR